MLPTYSVFNMLFKHSGTFSLEAVAAATPSHWE